MVDYNLIEDLKLQDGEVERMLREAYGDKVADGDMDTLISKEVSGYAPGSILKGHVVGFSGDHVVVDVGLKSEGLIDRNEFEDTDVAVGDVVEVLLESLEDETGGVRLSKRKADRIRGWET
ncbi:MAG: S1 RNA-binding domain-containing protein, partial [Phycisphaerales bacterium]